MQQKHSNINKKEFVLHIFESKGSSSLLEVIVVVVLPGIDGWWGRRG